MIKSKNEKMTTFHFYTTFTASCKMKTSLQCQFWVFDVLMKKSYIFALYKTYTEKLIK